MPNPSATLTLPPLNEDGICDRCERGSHRLCRDPDCECLAGTSPRHHANRPARDHSTPPQPQGDPEMTATAPTPIRPTPTATPAKKTPPTIGLKAVEELPDTSYNYKTLPNRVFAFLDVNKLEAEQWYELVVYPGRNGASGAVGRIRKDPRAESYEFEARGSIVYVRLAG